MIGSEVPSSKTWMFRRESGSLRAALPTRARRLGSLLPALEPLSLRQRPLSFRLDNHGHRAGSLLAALSARRSSRREHGPRSPGAALQLMALAAAPLLAQSALAVSEPKLA